MISQLSDLIVAGNVGIMLFFTVAVAPTIFIVLPAEWAAAYVRKFFPKYFLFLGITTTLGAALSAAGMAQAALVVCAVIFFFSCFWLTPRINQARDDKRGQAFKTLHYLSVGLNMLQLAVFIWILVRSVRSV